MKLEDKELRKELERINKELGTTLTTLNEAPNLQVEVIPTGSLNLDIATGRGGWPRGRIIELFGPQSGGKSTLSLYAAASAQKLGGRVAFIDAEYALDPQWAAKLGVDTDKLVIDQPDCGEQALETVCKLAPLMDVIIVDSVASLTPKGEIEGTIGDHAMLLHPKMMSEGLRKISVAIGKSRCVCIFVNQTREAPIAMGNPEITPGGKALKFYSSIRARVSVIGGSQKYDSKKTYIGHDVKVAIVKNKVAPPFKDAQVPLYFDRGIDTVVDLVNAAASMGVFQQSGAWIQFEEEKFNGWNKLEEKVRESKELQEKLLSKVVIR